MCEKPIKAYILNKRLMYEQEYRKLENDKQYALFTENDLEEIAKNIVNKDWEELENDTVIRKKGKNGKYNYKQIQQAHKIKRIVWNSSKKDKKYEQCYELKEINCNNCSQCLKQRAKNWAIRCEIEAKYWGKENCCFITLTYNNENLPKDRGLHKRDAQLFLKRLRKLHTGIKSWIDPKDKKECKPIRYLLSGEIGKHTLRPHYHAIIFNWRPDDLKIYKTNEYNQYLYTSQELEKIWGKGFVVIGNVDFESCGYVAQYCLKKLDNAFIARQGEQEFITMSRKNGIGCQILDKQDINDFNIYTKNGVHELPRYYKKKLTEKYEEENYINKKINYKELGIINIDGKKELCYKKVDNSIKKDIYNEYEKINNEHKAEIDYQKERTLHLTSDNEEEYNRKINEINIKKLNRIKRNDC